MKAFRTVTPPAVLLARAHFAADEIIPKQFLQPHDRTGFAAFLFSDLMRDPGFELPPHPRGHPPDSPHSGRGHSPDPAP